MNLLERFVGRKKPAKPGRAALRWGICRAQLLTLQRRQRPDNGDNILPLTMASQSALWARAQRRRAAQVFPPLSDSDPALWRSGSPGLLKGPTCQRRGGISLSQPSHCSPGHNGGAAFCHQLCCQPLLGQQRCNTPVTVD